MRKSGNLALELATRRLLIWLRPCHPMHLTAAASSLMYVLIIYLFDIGILHEKCLAFTSHIHHYYDFDPGPFYMGKLPSKTPHGMDQVRPED